MKKAPVKRPSDVDVCRPSDSESTSISKIENGYLVERSGYKGGQWYSKKHYTKDDPLKGVPKPKLP